MIYFRKSVDKITVNMTTMLNFKVTHLITKAHLIRKASIQGENDIPPAQNINCFPHRTTLKHTEIDKLNRDPPNLCIPPFE